MKRPALRAGLLLRLKVEGTFDSETACFVVLRLEIFDLFYWCVYFLLQVLSLYF